MTIAPSPSLYNQNTLGDEDFVANFVARHDLLEALLRRLRAIAPDDGGLHHILIGSRGMGKTSLLRRIAIAINRDPVLAAEFIPLRFREEQYNVLKLGDFWRNCGEALAEWAEGEGKHELAIHLDEAMTSPLWNSDEGAAEQFRSEVASLQRRAVLLVDNLDLILDALSEKDQWTLRRFLQARLGPVLIGAATHPLAQAGSRDAAFYEFFQPYHLEALGERETETCMRALATRRGNSGRHVIQVLDKQPERLRTLHNLTGGNPRILALIYRLLESDESEAAMADLEILLDQVTPYYKARVEEYQTPQQRAVIDAIALNWDPITTATLAGTTRVPSTTLSPLLAKLRRDGLIESVETSGSYSGHQLVERFLNIWYLMRHGTRRTKQRMRWLVGFLTSFYSSSDLEKIAERSGGGPFKRKWHRDYELAFNEALARKMTDNRLSSPYTPLGGADIGLTAPKDAQRPDRDEILRLQNRIKQSWESDNLNDCLAGLDELLSRIGDTDEPTLHEAAVRATLTKGLTLLRMGNRTAALEAFDHVLARNWDAETRILRHRISMALILKGVALGEMGQYSAAVAEFERLVSRFGDAAEPELREEVTAGLFNKAITLNRLGDAAAEIAALNDLLARYNGNSDIGNPTERSYIARSLLHRGVALAQTGDVAAGISSYDELIARFADIEDLGEHVAMAMLNRGISLAQLGDTEAEIAGYDAVISRFGEAKEPALLEQVARALAYRNALLLDRGDRAAAIEGSDRFLARFGDSENPALQELIAISLFNMAVAADGDSDGDDKMAAVKFYDTVIDRFGASEVLALRRQVAMAMANKGAILADSGDLLASVQLYQRMLDQIEDLADPALNEQAALALLNKGVALHRLGAIADEVANYDILLERFGDLNESGVRENVVRGLINKGITHGELGDIPAAVSSLEKAINLANERSDGPHPALAAIAQGRLADIMFDTLGEMARAEALYKEAARFESVVAKGNLGWLYILTGRVDDALQIRQSVDQMPAVGLSLLDAGIALIQDNFGIATDHLENALSGGLDSGEMDFSDDLERLLRLAKQHGYGERLLTWFETSHFDERAAPLYVALRAYVLGARTLLDVNLEVRRPAQLIFDRINSTHPGPKALSAPRRRAKKPPTS